jgi:hypothetical protein
LDAAAAAVEFHVAVNQSEKRVIVSPAHAFAWMKNGAQLPNNDVAGLYMFSAESFNAAALAVRVATVSAGALAFFMCHDISLRVQGSGFRIERKILF